MCTHFKVKNNLMDADLLNTHMFGVFVMVIPLVLGFPTIIVIVSETYLRHLL